MINQIDHSSGTYGDGMQTFDLAFCQIFAGIPEHQICEGKYGRKRVSKIMLQSGYG